MNVLDPEEIRVAIVGASGLEELYIERTGGGFVHGNIYKGKVQNIEPNLQAAFVDIGGEKNGFLHVSDVVPPHGGYEGILKKRRRKVPKDTCRMPIEEMLYVGQELLVQITREAIGNKGPGVTTYLSLPGRYLVLMPALPNKRGVSRKITDEKERAELKRALDELDPPKEMGYIVRTAGMGRGKEELKHDLDYLHRLWEAIVRQTKKSRAPATIYRESDLVIRAIRDYFYEDVQELLIDREEEWKRARAFLEEVMPEYADRAILYTDREPLFHRYGIETEVENLFARSVRLPSGGEIVIEQTEAMVTIDVNTGRFRTGENSRETILAINLEAAAEIARQLRLRDLGGIIAIDFIDMEEAADRRLVEQRFREALRNDRARTTVLPISQLGVLEMTRQRLRKSLKRAFYTVCPACKGSGLRKSPDALALELLRRLRAAFEERTGEMVVTLHPEMALEVANCRRGAIAALEAEKGGRIWIAADPDLPLDGIRLAWREEKEGDRSAEENGEI